MNVAAATLTGVGDDPGLGSSVAISSRLIVAGAPLADAGSNAEQGVVYVYARSSGGASGSLTPVARLIAGKGVQGDRMGAAVAISGNTIVAGAPGADVGSHAGQGAVYVFIEPARGWSGTVRSSAKLTAGGAGGGLGGAVAISGSTVVAGAQSAEVKGHEAQGEAFVFMRPRGRWPKRVAAPARLIDPHGSANDELGASVAVSGGLVVVGAPGRGTNSCELSDLSGYIEVYKPSRRGWQGTLDPIATLTGGGSGQPEQVGYSLAISGGAIFSGEPYPCVQGDGAQQTAGQIEVFTPPARGWKGQISASTLLMANYASLGQTFAVSGNTVIAPVPANTAVNYEGEISSPAAAVVFSKPAGGWPRAMSQSAVISAPASETQPGAGSAVALAGDTAVWGTSVITESGTGWSEATAAANLSIPSVRAASGEGYQVATSGSYVFSLTRSSAGTQDVLVFKKGASGWANSTPVAELVVNGVPSLRLDLNSIAASGPTVVVGTPDADAALDGSGLAFVFTEPAGGWTGDLSPTATLIPSQASATNQYEEGFGGSVAISGSTVFVGDATEDATNPNQAEIYTYNEPSGGWSGTRTEDGDLTVADLATFEGVRGPIAASGSTVVTGGGDGDAYVFTEPTGGWRGSINQAAVLKPLHPPAALEPVIGSSLAIDGSTIVAGTDLVPANGMGDLTYVFARPAGGWAGTLAPSATLTGADPQTGDKTALLAISGSTIIAGAPGVAAVQPPELPMGTLPPPAGIAVFQQPEHGWTGRQAPKAILTPDQPLDLNGPYSLALAGNTAIIGTTGKATYVMHVPAKLDGK
jgi:hypothetical protein